MNYVNEFLYNLQHIIWGVLKVTEVRLSQNLDIESCVFRGVDRTWEIA